VKHMTQDIEYEGRSMHFPVALKVGKNMRDTLEIPPGSKLGVGDAMEVITEAASFKEAQNMWKERGK
jgi:hypothetical protein